jgi:hypothetical protein
MCYLIVLYLRYVYKHLSSLNASLLAFPLYNHNYFTGILSHNSTMVSISTPSLLSVAVFATSTLAAAVPIPHALSNPVAAPIAQAYVDAYAEAVAIGNQDPEAYAQAASDDDCASFSCHLSCGQMIVTGQACSMDGSYTGPYIDGCLCDSTGNTDFLSYYNACMDCGWTLWKYYSPYLSPALEACNAEFPQYSTTPTGTSRCSTTLTSSYSVDTDINYSTYL